MVKLIGVYDADATLLGEVSYWIGARFGVRHCSLCDITHSLFREKSQWRECQSRLEHDLHVEIETFIAIISLMMCGRALPVGIRRL